MSIVPDFFVFIFIVRLSIFLADINYYIFLLYSQLDFELKIAISHLTEKSHT